MPVEIGHLLQTILGDLLRASQGVCRATLSVHNGTGRDTLLTNNPMSRKPRPKAQDAWVPSSIRTAWSLCVPRASWRGQLLLSTAGPVLRLLMAVVHLVSLLCAGASLARLPILGAARPGGHQRFHVTGNQLPEVPPPSSSP